MLRAKDLSLLIDKLSEANKNEDASHKELTNLSSLIQEFTTSRKDKIQEKQIRLRMDLDKTLELPLDRQSFQRVLLNLFANTVKYRTSPYSVVQITCLKKMERYSFPIMMMAQVYLRMHFPMYLNRDSAEKMHYTNRDQGLACISLQRLPQRIMVQRLHKMKMG